MLFNEIHNTTGIVTIVFLHFKERLKSNIWCNCTNLTLGHSKYCIVDDGYAFFITMLSPFFQHPCCESSVIARTIDKYWFLKYNSFFFFYTFKHALYCIFFLNSSSSLLSTICYYLSKLFCMIALTHKDQGLCVWRRSYDPERTVSQKGDPLPLMPSPVFSSLDARFLKVLVEPGFKV